MDQRICKTCSSQFRPGHSRHVYCAPACKPDDHPKIKGECIVCGTPVERSTGGQARRHGMTCSNECRALIRFGDKCPLPDNHPALPTPPDLRSPLRRAIESGNHSETIKAIRNCCIVTETGCWQWQRKMHATGYPVVSIAKQSKQVHRLSLEAKLGKTLGKQAAHHICANSGCVNPDHLQPVSQAANNAEMLARTYMVQRIGELEEALRAVHPQHELLTHASIDFVPTLRRVG